MHPGRGDGRGFSLVEVLLALLVIATLGVSIYGTMISTMRGVQFDRVSEVKRRLTHDLLERFCHPYSDIDSLFPSGTPSPGTRQISVDEAIALVGMPAREMPTLKAVLEVGGVVGFSMVWHRGLSSGAGDPTQALRLDRLWISPVVMVNQPGAQVRSFRIFYVRGS